MPQEYGLGRGLASLIPQKKVQGQNQQGDESKKKKEDRNSDSISVDENFEIDQKDWGSQKSVAKRTSTEVVSEVDIDKIKANPFQPRKNFDEDKLGELSKSIQKHGVIQPLIVTKKGDDFELIAGERRLQASKKAGMSKVPVVVKEVSDKDKMEWAIVENIQRHDLNPIEEARAYKRLMDDHGLHQDEVAEKMGKSRSLVANKVRLLELPTDVKKALIDGRITEGHAKAILSVSGDEKRKALLAMILKNNMTVRQTESKSGEIEVKKHKRKISTDPYLKELEDRLAEKLGTKVKVKKSGEEGGSVIIDYYSKEELDGIVENIA